jgi:hypothetical protein
MITLQFGPWNPDLANVPVQIPDTNGPVPIPCADCLNVYFANGAYKSIASPSIASIDGIPAAALSAQALNAFSYYDTVEQQSTIFAGTQTQVQQLAANGTWLTIPVTTTQAAALVGQQLASVTGFLGNTNGLHFASSMFSTGVVSPVNSSTVFVAGIDTGQPIIGVGVAPGPVFGNVLQQGLPFGSVYQIFDLSGFSFFYIKASPDPTQSAFTTVSINNRTYSSSAARFYSYNAASGLAEWSFNSPWGLASGSTYAVTLT